MSTPAADTRVLGTFGPKTRKALYTGYGIIGAIGAATVAFYAAVTPLVPGIVMPYWVVGGLAGWGALSPFFSTLAGANVTNPDRTSPPEEQVEAVEGAMIPPALRNRPVTDRAPDDPARWGAPVEGEGDGNL